MFKKLLANLPFNPSLLDRVASYYKTLRRETSIRGVGFIMIGLALAVQIAAIVSPPKESLASSPNDILSGIRSKDDILRAWDNNTNHTKDIYSKFGITRDNIAKISAESPNSVISPKDNDYWTLGRLPLGSYGISSRQWAERAIKTDNTTLYQRPIRALDNRASNTYEAFAGTNSYGVDFWVLKTSGSPVFESSYIPNAPAPTLEVHNTLISPNTAVHRGGILKFRVEYQNTQPDSLATGFRLQTTLSENLEYISLDNIDSKNNNTLTINRSGRLGYTTSPYVSVLTARVKSSTPNLSTLCNNASVHLDQTSDQSEKICATVVDLPQSAISAPSPSESLPSQLYNYCLASSNFATGSSQNFVVRTNSYVSSGLKVVGYDFDVDANNTIDSQDKSSSVTYEKQFNNLTPGLHTILVYAKFNNSAGQLSKTAPCQTQIKLSEAPRINLSKSVSNISKGRDANATTAQAGDILEFKLITKNVTASDYKNYNGEDYFGNILQYATIIDKNDLAAQGLSLNTSNNLKWIIPSLSANSTDTKTVKVRVKKSIPLTNNPSGLSPDYNCKISNDYGNEVAMDINCPLIKSIDQTGSNLPGTSAKTSLIVGVITVLIAGYFFNRSRLMAKELAVIRSDYLSAGGF